MSEMSIRCAGVTGAIDTLIVDIERRWYSGQVKGDGLSLRFEHQRAGFVVDFDDLVAAVEAVKKYRAENPVTA